MPSVLVEFSIIVLLILLNGFFALAELAIVSSRKSTLRQLADNGDPHAATALRFAENPGEFLSAVQVGITLIGIFTGAFGGATLTRELAAALATIPALSPYRVTIAFMIIVIGITYLTLIIGELAPKNVALNNPERWALRVAPIMSILTKVAAPIVRLLDRSTNLLLRTFHLKVPRTATVTDEEIALLLEEGVAAGVFDPEEKEIVRRLFRLSDRRVSAIMTIRADVVWLDRTSPPEEIINIIVQQPFNAYPVCDGEIGHVVGTVLAHDLVAQMLRGDPISLDAASSPPLLVHEGMYALTAMGRLKENATHMAIVLNEFGDVEGIATLTDILESLLGELPSAEEEREIVRREDGSFLVDGQLPVDEMQALLDIKELPPRERGLYQTIAGFILTHMGRVPTIGDTVTWGGYCFEIVDMDQHRIDRVLIRPLNR